MIDEHVNAAAETPAANRFAGLVVRSAARPCWRRCCGCRSCSPACPPTKAATPTSRSSGRAARSHLPAGLAGPAAGSAADLSVPAVDQRLRLDHPDRRACWPALSSRSRSASSDGCWSNRRVGVLAAFVYAVVGVGPHMEGMTLNGELLAGVPSTISIALAVWWYRRSKPLVGAVGRGPVRRARHHHEAVRHRRHRGRPGAARDRRLPLVAAADLPGPASRRRCLRASRTGSRSAGRPTGRRSPATSSPRWAAPAPTRAPAGTTFPCTPRTWPGTWR